MNTVEAIEWIEECKQTHDAWSEYQRRNPDWEKKTRPSNVGDADFHEHCAEKYGEVLEILRQLLADEESLTARLRLEREDAK